MFFFLFPCLFAPAGVHNQDVTGSDGFDVSYPEKILMNEPEMEKQKRFNPLHVFCSMVTVPGSQGTF